MLSINHVKGAVFDVDETLLDTGSDLRTNPKGGLHERARLQATLEAGQRHHIPELLSLTMEESTRAFLEAPVHTLEATIWHVLYTKGVVATDKAELGDPLLQEIATRKDELFEDLLRNEGKPYPGAVDFVHWLSGNGLQGRLAIASSAIRRDIDIFLEMTGLDKYFPPERIISKADITHAKPNPEAFDKAFLTLELLESDRGRVLAFEDNPRGIMSAKAAGLFTCAITTVLPREELAALTVPPDLIAASYDEFRELLSKPSTIVAR
ncbi:MAG TPA: HAD family phosphatase [Candidatus Saccharimonadales bacterium]|jgi:HAD superfamily hydrolase (TIGR01509 family)